MCYLYRLLIMGVMLSFSFSLVATQNTGAVGSPADKLAACTNSNSSGDDLSVNTTKILQNLTFQEEGPGRSLPDKRSARKRRSPSRGQGSGQR